MTVRTIHLVRHLPTDGSPRGRIDRGDVDAWLASEDDRGIVAGSEASAELRDVVAACRHLRVSPLRRAQETAATALAELDESARPEPVTLPDLREAPLPVLHLPVLRLPMDAWDVGARLAWMAGWSGGVESRRSCDRRASSAAGELHRLAADGPVTAIAHGFLNVMVARHLRRLGWFGPRIPAHHNGAVTAYTLGAT
ncbi:MAG TPA: histidine phosphatase family protein [Acidimicrobiales bacterium]